MHIIDSLLRFKKFSIIKHNSLSFELDQGVNYCRSLQKVQSVDDITFVDHLLSMTMSLVDHFLDEV